MSHLVVDQRSKTSSRLDDGWGGGKVALGEIKIERPFLYFHESGHGRIDQMTYAFVH